MWEINQNISFVNRKFDNFLPYVLLYECNGWMESNNLLPLLQVGFDFFGWIIWIKKMPPILSLIDFKLSTINFLPFHDKIY